MGHKEEQVSIITGHRGQRGLRKSRKNRKGKGKRCRGVREKGGGGERKRGKEGKVEGREKSGSGGQKHSLPAFESASELCKLAGRRVSRQLLKSHCLTDVYN